MLAYDTHTVKTHANLLQRAVQGADPCSSNVHIIGLSNGELGLLGGKKNV